MKIETKYDIVSAQNIGAKYDDGVKRLFKSKEIIVPIMEMIIPEFEGCSQQEILNCLDVTSITSEEVVSDAMVTEEEEYQILGDAKEQGIFDYLNGLFEGNINKVESYSHIEWEENFREEVTMSMTGFSDVLVRKTEERVKRENTMEIIWNMHQLNFTDDVISKVVKQPIDYVENVLKKDPPL